LNWGSVVVSGAREEAGRGNHSGAALLDYVRLLPDGDVEVKIQENHWASLVCGRSRTRIAGMSRESFPELPQMPEVLAEIPIGVLASMIAQTILRFRWKNRASR
jgi:DNA polymerase III subunit beta